MTREELARAIRLPAEAQGRAFEQGLVERIVDDVGEKAGTLPLLEFALTKLWEGQEAGWLTHDAYEPIGRVEGAVARHADSVYEDLGERGWEMSAGEREFVAAGMALRERREAEREAVRRRELEAAE
jgi:hypothetical protein